MNKSDQLANAEEPDAPPPVLGRWGNIYALVLGYLLLLMAGLYAATRAFTP